MKFVTGPNPETDLTDDQILEQCKMYIAALRIADEFGCDAIGIQYQQGLKDLAPASDLAEGLLNNVDRPPVLSRDGPRTLCRRARCRISMKWMNAPVWTRWSRIASGPSWAIDPETTLHDLRYGEDYDGEFVWVFEISGAAPPQHFIGGYAGHGERAAAAHVFPPGRRHGEGHQQAGRDRLEPHFRGRRQTQGRSGARGGSRLAARGN